VAKTEMGEVKEIKKGKEQTKPEAKKVSRGSDLTALSNTGP